jgi:hypothetical protein
MAKYRPPYLHLLIGVLVPGAVMGGARFIGQAPAQSSAGPIMIDEPDFVDFPEVSLSTSEEDDLLDQSVVIHSPFWFDETKFNDPSESMESLPEEMRQVRERLPSVLVTSILPHAKKPMAIINTQLFQIGDEVVDGWKLVAIVGDARAVVLMHKTGKRLTVELTQKP